MTHSHRRLLAAVAVIALSGLGALTQPRSPAAGPSPTADPDLALVPADALGFVHVRVADLYRSEHFREFRQLLAKAGDEAISAFNSRFVPAPASVDRVTFLVLPLAGDQREPQPVGALRTSRPC